MAVPLSLMMLHVQLRGPTHSPTTLLFFFTSYPLFDYVYIIVHIAFKISLGLMALCV